MGTRNKQKWLEAKRSHRRAMNETLVGLRFNSEDCLNDAALEKRKAKKIVKMFLEKWRGQ